MQLSRRAVVKSSVFGVLTASIPSIAYAREMSVEPGKVFHRYPSVDDAIVEELVGASHFNLARVKELVEPRPELARAMWDWGFGDWETALGAASHVGRFDIAKYLISKGARPDIFTFAMLGAHVAVKAMVEASPGIQTTAGPHGISLLQHAKNGARSESAVASQAQACIAYLEGLGDAEPNTNFLEHPEAEQTRFLGDYRYGDGPTEGFSVKQNQRKMLSLGKLGAFGGGLFRTGANAFQYNGCPSVEITFQLEGERVLSLTVKEPAFTLVARRV